MSDYFNQHTLHELVALREELNQTIEQKSGRQPEVTAGEVCEPISGDKSTTIELADFVHNLAAEDKAATLQIDEKGSVKVVLRKLPRKIPTLLRKLEKARPLVQALLQSKAVTIEDLLEDQPVTPTENGNELYRGDKGTTVDLGEFVESLAAEDKAAVLEIGEKGSVKVVLKKLPRKLASILRKVEKARPLVQTLLQAKGIELVDLLDG